MPLIGLTCPKDSMNRTPAVCMACHGCMSKPLLKAIIGEYREVKKERWSVTEILDPPQLVYLRRNRDYYCNPYSLVWAVFGSAVHNILQHHGDGSTEENPTQYEVEKKFEAPVCGITLVGKVDLWDKEEKALWDYKTIKEYSVLLMKKGVWDNKYKDQMNIYKVYGFPTAEKLMLECIVKDHRADSECNPVEDIEVPIENVAQVIIQTNDLLRKHLDTQETGIFTPCTDEERWINKNPRSKNYMIPLRCRDYCAVSSICPQHQGERYETRENKYY